MNLKVKGLDGKIYPWNPSQGITTSQKKSSYYETAKILLRNLYPIEPILEEVSLPGTRPTLFADFVLTRRKMIVEVHGEQHYECLDDFQPTRFNPTRKKLRDAQRNDTKKKTWCEINGFDFIELPYFEDIHAWRSRITSIGDE